MIRSLLLLLSSAGWAKTLVRDWGIARRTARRFVAGESLSDAIRVSRSLADHGMSTSLALLGEDVGTQSEAALAREQLLRLIKAIADNHLSANASVKLTQLGLGINFDLCMENVLEVARESAIREVFIRIDMEGSPTIDQTLSIHHNLEAQGLHNIGLVFQAALYRSERDVRSTTEAGTAVRIVKGAYREPHSIAFDKKSDVDQNFDRLTELVFESAIRRGGLPASRDGRTPPMVAIATHDHRRIEFAEELAREIGLPKAAIEFQMLYGIRAELQRSLLASGYPVRIYVPYGAEWYPYLMRRLAERPANLWFLISNLFRR